jgi:hypothetical protein
MYVYPDGWARLTLPNVRAELLGRLTELCDPAQTALWLAKDPNGPIVGIDETFHFFFDDHDFDDGDVGSALFDEGEVRIIAAVKDSLDAILETNRNGDDAYFLGHPLWPKVVAAAEIAYDHLPQHGIANWVTP